MKYKTFKKITGVIKALLFLALPASCIVWIASEDEPGTEMNQVEVASPANSGDPLALRPFDSKILELIDLPIQAGKGKDVLRGAWKVNVYDDNGDESVDRLKIDLDRNDKWDEKWTISEGGRSVKRQVAPADDEQYTLEYQLGEGRWIDSAAPAVEVEALNEAPSVETGKALRSFDLLIFELVDRNISGDKVKDALGPTKVKVNLYRDAGKDSINRLKIDLDRDEKWDEKWDFEPAPDGLKVKRHVAPADDENYSLEYRLVDGWWVSK